MTKEGKVTNSNMPYRNLTSKEYIFLKLVIKKQKKVLLLFYFASF